MKPVKAIRITVAAGMLGVGPKILLRAMRARNILDATNKPAQEYVDAGQLDAEWIPVPMGRTGITKHFLSPTVTLKGWPIIELIARDIRHGAEEMATADSSRNSRPAHCLTAAESHQRIAGIMQILGDDACKADVRAA